MFGVDDLLLLPMRGLLAVCREIHDAAEQDTLNEADAIRRTLRELYMMLETGRLTEAEFDAQEKALLDRLDAIESPSPPGRG